MHDNTRARRRDGLVVAAAVSWLVAPVQFLAVHLVVESAWSRPYSWASNNVSDLGNTACRIWDGRPVCSPLHVPMNVSFVVTGMLLVIGVVCLAVARRRVPIGHACLVVSAAGWVLAGLAPADVDENRHLLAAIGILVVGNVGLLLTAADRRAVPWSRTVAWAAVPIGVFGTVATVLFVARIDPGIGPGGTERVAAFGVLVWTVLAAGSALCRLPRPRAQPGQASRRHDRRPRGTTFAHRAPHSAAHDQEPSRRGRP